MAGATFLPQSWAYLHVRYTIAKTALTISRFCSRVPLVFLSSNCFPVVLMRPVHAHFAAERGRDDDRDFLSSTRASWQWFHRNATVEPMRALAAVIPRARLMDRRCPRSTRAP